MVWFWLGYLFTPSAPFYICGGRFLGRNDELRFDVYQLQKVMSISALCVPAFSGFGMSQSRAGDCNMVNFCTKVRILE
jgi:hypothetical protein